MLLKDEVLKIAKLAHLSLSDEEATELLGELNSIFKYIEQLNSIDSRIVEPMSHVHGSTNIFREDAVCQSMPIEDVLKNTPDSSGRFIRVPIIIDQDY